MFCCDNRCIPNQKSAPRGHQSHFGLDWYAMSWTVLCPNLTDLISEILKRAFRPQRSQQATIPINTEVTVQLERRPTFPPLASRSSTFDQNLPPYTKQDPIPQSSNISTIGEDVSGEESRAVTPSRVSTSSPTNRH
jgi:hypothetical protein